MKQYELFYMNITYDTIKNIEENYYLYEPMGKVVLYNGEKTGNTISERTIENTLQSHQRNKEISDRVKSYYNK